MDETEIAVEAIDLSPRQKLLSDVGQKLTQAREARHEQLSIVVRKLKLSEANLKALEEGDWDCLPDDIYALGFLRQYSSYLALDLENEIQHIKNDQYTLTRPLTFPDPPVAPSYRWAWIAGTAFIILFITFNLVNKDTVQDFLISPKITPQKKEQIATDTTSSAQQILPTTENSVANDSPPVPASASPLIEVTPEHAATTETATVISETPSAPQAVINLTTVPVLPAGSMETIKPADHEPTVHNFRFEAVTESVWLQVFRPDETGNAKGKLVKEVLLQKGHHVIITEATDSLWITSGNPAAMRIEVDGQVQAELGSLGDVGKVLRNYHFKVAR